MVEFVRVSLEFSLDVSKLTDEAQGKLDQLAGLVYSALKSGLPIPTSALTSNRSSSPLGVV